MPRIAAEIRAAVAEANVNISTVVETIGARIDGISTENADEDIVLQGLAVVTTGVGTTAVTMRVRRGTAITDPLVGELANLTIGAAVNGQPRIIVKDNPGVVANQSYIVTVQQAGATGDGTLASSALIAFVGAQAS